ncbi:hypothetical protein FPG59_04605 [Flavobacterium sp. FPG59]|nr:hypothetical protein FPG59_04605 [Flavobacterium sp. FPG59]
MTTRKKFAIIISFLLLLLAPLIAMQFTKEVQWSLFDFAVAALLLSFTALIIMFILHWLQKTKFRFLILLFVILAFLLLWAELAVGVFNSPISGK